MKAGINFVVSAAVAVDIIIIIWGVVCSSMLLVSVPTPPFSSVTLGNLLNRFICIMEKIVVPVAEDRCRN